jgi:hypothetical protein
MKKQHKILAAIFLALIAAALLFGQAGFRNADQVLSAIYDSTLTAIGMAYAPGTNTDFNAVAATDTKTSTAYGKTGYYKTAVLFVTWNGITGSPSGCTIQPYVSADGTNFFASGSAISVTPGTTLMTTFSGTLGTSIKYVYACTTYPTAGTLTLQTIYKQ